MFDVFDNDSDFYKYYLQLFPARYTDNCFSSFLYYVVQQLELRNTNIVNSDELRMLRENTLKSTTNAVNYLFDNEGIDKLYPHHIKGVANLINEYEGYEGYRTTTVDVWESAFVPTPAGGIPAKMMSLIDNYYNVWNILDPYEREARFHLFMVRVQPFEDGNKRTAQLITGFNLMKNGCPPILIKENDRDKYLEYIIKNDVNSFADFLKTKSAEELEYIKQLYLQYKNQNTNSALSR
ncbi:MAG: Fic family protein [Bacilli bacterium]|nr:Fic family protein [Bacilli bacterium]MDD3305392.1 Fic family protein [Bacilli bacterium]MDD4053953.1 Fic family protein [Bacilli bacterium]MDD4411213.1 Fic family protein [Bacilli bacterium]